MKKLLKLILVDLGKEPKIVVDKRTGENLKKWRHAFMTPEGTELIAFANDDAYKVDVTPVLTWDESKAKDWLFNSRTWEGKEVLGLIDRAEAKAFIAALPKK